MLAAASTPEAVCLALQSRWLESDSLREEMVALQEELDWRVYCLFGIVDDPNLIHEREAEFYCPRGDRPFERMLGHTAGVRRDGRALTSDEATVQTGRYLPTGLEALWKRRQEAIRSSRLLALIETSVFKRSWRDTEHNIPETEYRTTKDRNDVSSWLLSRVESCLVESFRLPLSVREAANALQLDAAVRAVAEVLAGDTDFDLARVLSEFVVTDAVPYLAALCYSDTGLEKRAAWEGTWDLQRREDSGEAVDIAVPPRYDSGDFQSATYWSLRGKLDVPKERFVLYPGAGRDDDPTPLILWAGADHLDRALALAALYHDRQSVEGWPSDRLIPLLAGLLELVPWVRQWHNDPNPARGGQRMGDYFARFVEEEARRHGRTLDDLRAWRPEASVRHRGRKATSA